ncbi:MAG: family 43 glycosylhydrolase [Bacteroidales bacterium]|jgi:beta-xylosidase|nr:family 43 glycosylhydrolase [Bacteroidales bacterium]
MKRPLNIISIAAIFVFAVCSCCGTGRGDFNKSAIFDYFTYSVPNPSGMDSSAVPQENCLKITPSIVGCSPDPSLCRVGEDYYLVNSTFAYFPGVPIYHSRNLKQWEHIGYVLNRPSQLNMKGNVSIESGIYAPDISFNPSDSLFYMITTCVACGGTFYVYTKDPRKEHWSDPVYLTTIDGIDPSFFFGRDGKAYVLNSGTPEGGPKYQGHCSIWIREIDIEKGRTTGKPHLLIERGTNLFEEPTYIEGPHLFYIHGRYFLMAAEGGTDMNHSEVLFESDSLLGPYRQCAINPILTQRDLPPDRPNPITCTGHADLVQTASGDWYAAFLAVRPYKGIHDIMGRETFILPVEWKNGQPVILQSGKVLCDTGDKYCRDTSLWTSGGLSGDAFFIRTPQTKFYKILWNCKLSLEAKKARMGDPAQPAAILRKITARHFVAETAVSFKAGGPNDFAGMTVFQDDGCYIKFGNAGGNRVIMQTYSKGKLVAEASERITSGISKLYLKIEGVDKVSFRFSYSVNCNNRWEKLGDDVSADFLSPSLPGRFTGDMVGIYATSPDDETALKLNPLFTDHMVLQRDADVSVFGEGKPYEKITVRYHNRKYSGRSDGKGMWRIRLGNLKASDNDKMNVMEIYSGKDTIRLKDVVNGDVWLCGGQSNMEMNLACKWAKVKNSAEEVAAANYPMLRLLQINKRASCHEEKEPLTSGWVRCNPETAASFSAVGYFFSRDVFKELDVPVGVISCNWGGTIAEAWMSRESFAPGSFPRKYADMAALLPCDPSDMKDSLLAQHGRLMLDKYANDPGFEGDSAVFASTLFSDKDWFSVNLPFYVENTPVGDMNGGMWVRKHFYLTAAMADGNYELHSGPFDDCDHTWINGRLLGNTCGWNINRVYDVDSSVLHTGDNVMTVWIEDITGNGGFSGQPDGQFLVSRGGPSHVKISLGKGWKLHVGYSAQDITVPYIREGEPNFPSVLYNGMINPLVRFPVKGCLWYQGENNTYYAGQYGKYLSGLINGWRKAWNEKDMPFIIVQLPNFMARKTEPSESEWAELRERQDSVSRNMKNVYMACIIDKGEANTIHPSDKQDVGRRLADIALSKIYKIKKPAEYPMITSIRINGSSALVKFNFPMDSIRIYGPGSFAVAGPDKRFYRAEVLPVPEGISLSSPKVDDIRAVRYAWADNPGSSVFSLSGLPLLPYRSDKWPGLTTGKHGEYL